MLRFVFKLLGAAATVALAWIFLVSFAPGSWIASFAPCPRNLAWGPAWLPRASPLESLSIALPDGKAKLCYGSPSLGGRTMIGGDAVPYGELWRLGANEPTTLHTNRLLYIGDMVLAPGSYSIYAVPGNREWTLFVNRRTHQWGLESEYTDEIREHELGSIRVQAQPLESTVEKMTFRSEVSAIGAVELVFEWQNTRWRLPLSTRGVELEPGEESTPTGDL